jgi:hypothetical protein
LVALAVKEKPDALGGPESPGFEKPRAKADFGGSGVGVEVDGADDSPDLGARLKGNWVVGEELGGGVNDGNEKPPVFVPLSLVEGGFEDAPLVPVNPAKDTGGFGMANCGAAGFSGTEGFTPKGDEELAGLAPLESCEESSNSD